MRNYINHGYRRVKFHIDEILEFDQKTSKNEFIDLIEHNFNPPGSPQGENLKWQYCVYVNELWDDSNFGITLNHRYIGIARSKCGYVNVEQTVLMHEVGHTCYIEDYEDNREIYCSNWQCVMAVITGANCIDYSFYCAHHWRKRAFKYEYLPPS